MLTHNVVKQVDGNNFKALGIVSLAILALENGYDDFDIIEILEVIRDYLTANNKMFDGLT
jgi:hypothetical protein